MNDKNKLVVFQDKKIRRIWHDDEWYFSVIDVVQNLTDSNNPRNYWSMLKKREEGIGIELSTNCVRLKLPSSDGKSYMTDCANTRNLFRLIQSIPSKKAEPFKQWLAQVGYERIEEIENPELGQDRIKDYYELKGYPKEWIDKRLRGIAIRQELTDEWKNREIETEKEFAILTNEISKATFGKTVGEYKDFKQLKKKNQNLRDHMTDLELIFTMLGEASTTAITKEENSQGFGECKTSANKGGNVARRAREDLERNLEKPIISGANYLPKKNEQRISTNNVVIKKSKVGQFDKGVFANRDFENGETVIKYKLRPLTKKEFNNLPKKEKIFTHTHRGQIYLYPPPERFVNHSSDPNTHPDLKNKCDVAIRDIKKGEEITTDARKDDIA